MIRSLLAGMAVVTTAAMLMLPAIAQEPGVWVRSVRVPVSDPPAAAVFYQRAFGMHEIRRIEGKGFVEVILNSGATTEVARANPKAPIVLMTRPKDMEIGAMAYVILGVKDLSAAIAAVEAAGGTLFRKPVTSASGLSYAFVKDPEGNQIELIASP